MEKPTSNDPKVGGNHLPQLPLSESSALHLAVLNVIGCACSIFLQRRPKKNENTEMASFFLKKKLNLKENGKSYRKSVFEKFFFFVLALSSYAKIFHVCCEIEKLPRFHPSKPFTNLMVLPIKFPFMYC